MLSRVGAVLVCDTSPASCAFNDDALRKSDSYRKRALLMISGQEDKRSVATDDDSSNTAGYIKNSTGNQ